MGQVQRSYGKRLASHVGSNAIRQSFSMAYQKLGGLGFEHQQTERLWPRLSDALVQMSLHRRSGKRVISVPIFTGAYVGSIIRRNLVPRYRIKTVFVQAAIRWPLGLG